jgi:hypothetical protein
MTIEGSLGLYLGGLLDQPDLSTIDLLVLSALIATAILTCCWIMRD